MRKTSIFAVVLTLAGCGLSNDERAAYAQAAQQALRDCRDRSSDYAPARCNDYNQLQQALAENKRLQDY